MFARIVVALKFNEAGRRALDFAARLAALHGASLTVFHALDYHLAGRPADDPTLLWVLGKARAQFEEFVAGLDVRPPAVELVCEPGEPSIGVCRLARDLPADLIVFGCHQKAGSCLSRMDYTGMTILDKAPCPVMLVPTRD